MKRPNHGDYLSTGAAHTLEHLFATYARNSAFQALSLIHILYGVETSMATLGNLYGVNVDHYIRINFAGFISIIDALGGVDVYSCLLYTSRCV